MNKPTTWQEMYSFVKDNLSGEGIEIGPLHNKFEINDKTTMRYADIHTTSKLKELYKDDEGVDISKIPNIGLIIEDGLIPTKRLFNFVCHSHMFEHCEDIGNRLKHWLSLLKKNGYIYMIVPDKNHTFDSGRAITSLQHFIDDYKNKPLLTSIEHYLDYCHNVEKNASRAAEAYGNQDNIHVHVFDEDSLRRVLTYFSTELGYKVLFVIKDGMHLGCLLQKNG